MGVGKKSKTRPDMVGPLNPRWARDERVARGQQFGSWRVLSDGPFALYGALYVMARCACGVEKEVNLRFMETGRSSSCRACATRTQHKQAGRLIVDTLEKKLLQKRVNAMRQRCCNTRDRSFHNYGGRGIEFRFSSIRDGVDYILTTLPARSYVGLDIDRINNDGHYERGNLRLVTRKENLANRGQFVRMTSLTVDRTPGLPRTV